MKILYPKSVTIIIRKDKKELISEKDGWQLIIQRERRNEKQKGIWNRVKEHGLAFCDEQ